MIAQGALVSWLGQCEYAAIYARMQHFTETREADTTDEIWSLEHPPTYTMGLSDADKFILAPQQIPIIKTDRGGKVTYHGPGQLLIYPLIDLRRLELSIRAYVWRLEQAVIDFLMKYGIVANRQPGAPGVYIKQQKIAALGIRVRRGASYHGLALNVAMDLTPYEGIHPCGDPRLEMTMLQMFGVDLTVQEVSTQLIPHLCQQLYASTANISYKA